MEFSTFWGSVEHLAHAVHARQLLRRGVEHALQRTEPFQQPVRRLVGVLPGDGVKQQQLQQLVVLQPLGAHRQIPALAALSMPVVQSHSTSPLPAANRQILDCIVYHTSSPLTSTFPRRAARFRPSFLTFPRRCGIVSPLSAATG